MRVILGIVGQASNELRLKVACSLARGVLSGIYTGLKGPIKPADCLWEILDLNKQSLAAVSAGRMSATAAVLPHDVIHRMGVNRSV